MWTQEAATFTMVGVDNTPVYRLDRADRLQPSFDSKLLLRKPGTQTERDRKNQKKA
jgi:hypothetical protein